MTTIAPPVVTQSPSIREINRRLFRGSVIPTVVVTSVGAAVAAVVGTRKDAIAVVVAGVVVVGFFAIGLWVSTRTSQQHPFAVMASAMTAYVVEIIGLGVALLVFRDTSLFEARTFGFAVLGASVVWLAAQVTTFVRMRVPTIEPFPPVQP